MHAAPVADTATGADAATDADAATGAVLKKPRRSGLGISRGDTSIRKGMVVRKGVLAVLLRKRAEDLSPFYVGSGVECSSIVEIDEAVTASSGVVYLLVHQLETGMMGWINEAYIECL